MKRGHVAGSGTKGRPRSPGSGPVSDAAAFPGLAGVGVPPRGTFAAISRPVENQLRNVLITSIVLAGSGRLV
jgi:hypothetical protein